MPPLRPRQGGPGYHTVQVTYLWVTDTFPMGGSVNFNSRIIQKNCVEFLLLLYFLLNFGTERAEDNPGNNIQPL